jgi:hypothetical protein
MNPAVDNCDLWKGVPRRKNNVTIYIIITKTINTPVDTMSECCIYVHLAMSVI